MLIQDSGVKSKLMNKLGLLRNDIPVVYQEMNANGATVDAYKGEIKNLVHDTQQLGGFISRLKNA